MLLPNGGHITDVPYLWHVVVVVVGVGVALIGVGRWVIPSEQCETARQGPLAGVAHLWVLVEVAHDGHVVGHVEVCEVARLLVGSGRVSKGGCEN